MKTDIQNQAEIWFKAGVNTVPRALKLKQRIFRTQGMGVASVIYTEVVKLIKKR